MYGQITKSIYYLIDPKIYIRKQHHIYGLNKLCIHTKESEYKINM